MPAAPASYPPEPWHLGGSMLGTLWRVDAADVRHEVAPCLPADVTPLIRGRHALVVTAFVRYAPGGVLSYDELLVAVVARRGWRPITTIPRIWVDSPASAAGGRALWGIPKALATFEQEWDGPILARASVDGAPLAAVRADQGRGVPGWRRLPLPVAQRRDGDATYADVQALGRLHRASASWTVPPDGPLGFVARGRPLASATLRAMTIRFGPSVSTPDPAGASEPVVPAVSVDG